MTAAMLAVTRESLNYLSPHAADVNAKNEFGGTPLHQAAQLQWTRKSSNYSSPQVRM